MELKIQESANYTTTVFCARFVDILNKTMDEGAEYNEQYNKSLSETTRLTIRDILDFTPSKEQVLFGCGFRNETTNQMIMHYNGTCEKFFRTVKVVNNEHVCYYFIPKELKAYNMEEVGSQLTYGNQIYELVLDRRMSDSNFNFIIIHTVRPEDSSFHPLVSRRYAERIYQNKRTPIGHYIIYGASTSYSRLPKPFDTKCTPKHNSNKCYDDCLIREFAKFNRIPWCAFVEKRLDMHMLSYKDLENDSVLKYVIYSKKLCDFQCRRRVRCSGGFSQTRAVGLGPNPGMNGKIRISVMMPSAPVVRMDTLPVVSFIEYILLVGSSLGFWFGSSVWSLSPLFRLSWRGIKQLVKETVMESQLNKFNNKINKNSRKRKGFKITPSQWQLVQYNQRYAYRFETR